MNSWSSRFYFLALKCDAYQELNLICEITSWQVDYSLLNLAQGGLHSLSVKCLQFA